MKLVNSKRFGLLTRSLVVLFALIACAKVPAQTVAFPGPPPGPAHAAKSGSGTFTLSNNLLSMSWSVDAHGRLAPSGITNALNHQKTLSTPCDLFRIYTRAIDDPAVAAAGDGAYLGLRLSKTSVSAVYGDGQSWLTLKSFPRDQFPGRPTILRIGKLSLNADNTDYSDPGSPGTCYIDHINPAITSPAFVQSAQAGTKVSLDSGRLRIDAGANTTAYAEYNFPAAAAFVSARITKNNDQGMSWGPGLALVWPNGKFVLVNARVPIGQYSVTTQQGESVIMNVAPSVDYNAPSSTFHLTAPPTISSIPGGVELTANVRSDSKPIAVAWHAILRNGANYVRQEFKITSFGDAALLAGVELVDFPVSGTEQVGSVPGSPIAGANWFFGCELPVGFNNTVNEARSAIACQLPLVSGASYSFSSVAGVYPEGQLRRSVLSYIEHERARPTKPFLEYNCWYDLAQGVTAATFSDAINGFNQQLTIDRGVKLDSYVIDDGWDDHVNSFWGVDPVKFPEGFAPIANQLKGDGSHLGLWISPLGGYAERPMRTENARKLGLVTGPSLDLSNPSYYAWFKAYLLKLMTTYQVNYFKWDKAGDGVTPHFMALLRVADELRKSNPNLFLNVTVGTWPSPFWLNHIDCTWRGGGDVGWTGDGDKREQWLNYRDQEIYRNVVEAAPLYPLNSLMHHGVVLGNFYQGGELRDASAFNLRHDVRLYFANGSTLKELYLTPSLMTQAAWDDVAASAKWSLSNKDVLADSHWIGGDPGAGEVYGYASWSPRKGIFVLRNPSSRQGVISLDAAKIFELPSGAARSYRLTSPYPDQAVQVKALHAGMQAKFTLKPFDVLVFEANPE
jgi:hypothetical protein